jgi:hypothetical protein
MEDIFVWDFSSVYGPNDERVRLVERIGRS